MKLLSVENDHKTAKGSKEGVLTGVLYLAPNHISGYEVCPKSTAGCRAACLYTAGRGTFNNVKASRIAKTKLFFEARELFMAYLVEDLQRLVAQASKRGMTPAVRLNGTSDIVWEKIAVPGHRSVFAMFPNVQFYDYTKVFTRKAALQVPNYHLTFSLSEDNEADARKALANGFNVAVVMWLRPHEPKPATFWNRVVIDGDANDLRFFNNIGGCIIALSAKGRAKHDTTGFVQRTSNELSIKLLDQPADVARNARDRPGQQRGRQVMGAAAAA